MLTLDNDEWLLADIGGTYARFLHQRVPGAGTVPAAGVFQRLRTDQHASLAGAVAAFEAAAGAHAPQAALAVAAPILGDRLRLTNRDWQFDAAGLRAACGWRRLIIVNDFAAAAAGLPALQAADRQSLQAGTPNTRPLLLLGPGTGLGCAALLDAGSTIERVLASEAGHMSFAPPDPRADLPLQRAACDRWGRVSWERLLCGSGLAWLYGQLAERADGDAGIAVGAADVVQRALDGEDLARAAITRFCAWFGACAGDLCLAFGADGGVHLIGGVVTGLGAAFDSESFLRAFRDKGRAAARLAQVPVWRLQCDDLAFRGLQRIIAGASRAPGLSVDDEGRVLLA